MEYIQARVTPKILQPFIPVRGRCRNSRHTTKDLQRFIISEANCIVIRTQGAGRTGAGRSREESARRLGAGRFRYVSMGSTSATTAPATLLRGEKHCFTGRESCPTQHVGSGSRTRTQAPVHGPRWCSLLLPQLSSDSSEINLV